MVVIAAGCGGGADAKLDACALLPEARVTKATGERVLSASNRNLGSNSATCGFVLESFAGIDPKDLKLVTLTIGRVGPGRIPGLFESGDSAADLDALTLGEATKKRVGELGDRAVVYTWAKSSAFRIVAARGGDFVSLDGQNIEEKGGELMVRDVFVALERRGAPG
jgi:hypothetical protein